MPEQTLIRKRIFLATITMSACVLAAFGLAAYSFSVVHSNSQDIAQRAQHDRLVLCQAQNESNMAVRRVLTLAEQLVRKAKNVPPKERLRSVDFYRTALSLVKPINCRILIQAK